MEIRKAIYTTNAIELLNMTLLKGAEKLPNFPHQGICSESRLLGDPEHR